MADGHQVDVLASDAHDLWYFTDPSRGRSEEPRDEVIDGARVRRFPIRHWRGQKYAGRLLSYLPIWRAQCRYESFMPIVPGIDRVRGKYDAVFSVAFPYTLFSHAAWKTARAARAPVIITPFLHLATPGDKVNRIYTRPHQGRLLREAAAVFTMTNLEADADIRLDNFDLVTKPRKRRHRLPIGVVPRIGNLVMNLIHDLDRHHEVPQQTDTSDPGKRQHRTGVGDDDGDIDGLAAH